MRSLLGVSAFLAILVGCGSDDPAGGEPRSVAIEAREFTFSADEAIVIEAGDTIRFEVTNAGNLDHQMEVLTDANRRLGMTERIPPGERRAVTVTFEESGNYSVICDIDNHRAEGQQAQFVVMNSATGT